MLSEDAKALMNYLKTLINDEKLGADIPEIFVEDDDFRELSENIRSIRNFGVALGKGDISENIQGSGYLVKSMESFQERFKYFGSKAYDIIPRDLSVVNELSFEFSDIFDSMQKQIDYSITKFRESEERYRLLIDNAGDIISTVNLGGNTYISLSVEKITVSLGVSVYRCDVSVYTIISRADQALYASKHKGRNQVQLI